MPSFAWFHVGPTFWAQTVTETTSIDVEGLAGLEVKTHNGTITFAGDDTGSTAAVTATKRAGAWTPTTAKEALAAIEVYVEPGDNGTTRIGWRWNVVKHPGWRAQVSFDIQGPAELNLQAETHNGGVTVGNVEGDVRLVTHNGGVEVNSSKGTLYAETHNGDIEAEYAGEDVTLLTHNGRVKASLDRCVSVGGTIETHNGAVDLVLGTATSADLQCQTHNGRIKCDVPLKLGEFSRSRLTGTIGEGGDTLDVITHNGSVRIRQAAG